MTSASSQSSTSSTPTTVKRCDEEPITIPDSIQSFGCMVVVQEAEDGALIVLKASENCADIIGLSYDHLFNLGSFYDCLEEEQAEILYRNLNVLESKTESLQSSAPQVFLLSGISQNEHLWRCWCAAHEINNNGSNGDLLIILEFEPATNDASIFSGQESIVLDQGMTRSDRGMEKPPYTPTLEQLIDSTEKTSKPLRALSGRRVPGRLKRRLNVMKTTSPEGSKREPSRLTVSSSNMQMTQLLNQVHEQLSIQTTLISLFKTTVGIMRDITSFTRAAIYRFDQEDWTGQVVAELVDNKITQDFLQGLHFPAGDIPKQARDLYTINKVRMMFDREAKTSEIISKDQQNSPIDMTFAFLRAMSPYHTLYLANMGVRSSLSISITAFNCLWGLIILHYYGDQGKRVSFPMRLLCKQVGEAISRNIERINRENQDRFDSLVSSCISSNEANHLLFNRADDLLDLFNASYGVMSVGKERSFMGEEAWSQECLETYFFLQKQRHIDIVVSDDVKMHMPGLYLGKEPQLTKRALLVPLSDDGTDFLAVFRKVRLKEFKWAGQPEDITKTSTEPRKSFESWTKNTVEESVPWEEDKKEAAIMLKLKFCQR